jgi:radical SAM protein with 4Fe4S-binding SPASM domain
MPFNHLNIKQEGKISACWRYPDRLGDYTKNSLEEIWNNDETKELRRALLNNEKPDGCRSCWDLEASGSTSTRATCTQTYDNVTLEKVLENVKDDYSYPMEGLKSVEIRFDNVCNLMCRHCSPDYSSVWEQAVKKDTALMDKMVEYGTYRKSKDHIKLTDEMIEEVTIKFAPHLEEIMIAGGEPLYHEKHYQFLENLQPYAQNLRLSYNTNLNTISYKGKSILDLWKNFKEIWIRISLDGDPSCYDYARVASNLPKVEQNIKELNANLTNADISATCTVSLYNITRLVDVIEYFTKLDVYFHTSLVQYPEALNIKLLPQHLKNKITDDFNSWLEDDPLTKVISLSNKIKPEKQVARIKKFGSNVIRYMNSDDKHDQWNTFLDYSSALDNFHNTDLLKVYPEYNF